MRKVLTSEQMREVDRLTTERFGIPQLLLMENAAHSAARVICDKMGGSVEGRSVLVLCGKGNNGGDGAALGRVLWSMGADVEVCLFGLVDATKEDARVNFEIVRKLSERESLELEQADLAFEEITSIEEWLEYELVNFHSDDPEIIVDALFGTGLTRPLDGVFEQVAGYIAAFTDQEPEQGTLVVSLDVPSGLNSDKAERIGVNAAAHMTVTFTAPKPANVLPPASNHNGELFVECIGSPVELINEADSPLFTSDADDAAEWLAKSDFSPDSYKKTRGHLLIAAGSSDFAGAAALCGNAALRTGVGLVTLVTPESARGAVASRTLPEVIVRALPTDPGGVFTEKVFPEFSELAEKADVIAIGSGLTSNNETTREFVRKVVEGRQQPLVIDADGLNALSPFDLHGPPELPIVLTPHEGEFRRLTGNADVNALDDRVGACREFAERHAVILVLKGERVLVASPEGKVVINPTGNSGLGKAGNGDTLTGIIAGFIAQAVQAKIDIFETVVAAVYIAGLAGDIAEGKLGKRVMTASDVSESLAEAFCEICG